MLYLRRSFPVTDLNGYQLSIVRERGDEELVTDAGRRHLEELDLHALIPERVHERVEARGRSAVNERRGTDREDVPALRMKRTLTEAAEQRARLSGGEVIANALRIGTEEVHVGEA